ncbi:MAG: TIGR02597 family protein [Verrucomicrobiota bacterium JB022]|nr:TIGR02597 family protein [Verrucomicrobiota bacterium JB022]
MKFSQSIGLLAGLLLSGGAAMAQSAATDPAFIQTVSLQPGSDYALAFPLDTLAVYQGAIASTTSSSLQVTGSPNWAPNNWAGSIPYQVLVLSGELEGATFPISANGPSTLTVAFGLEDRAQLAAGDLVQIQRAWTPSDLSEMADLPEGTQLIVQGMNPGTGSMQTAVYTYYVDYGWFDGSFGEADSAPLNRGAGFILRLPAAGEATELVMAGQVPMTVQRMRFRMPAGEKYRDFRFGIMSTEPINLDAAGLVDRVEAQLFVYDNATAGINKLPAKTLSAFPGWGWYDERFQEAGSTTDLLPGQSYILRHFDAGVDLVYTWTWLPSYLQ